MKRWMMIVLLILVTVCGLGLGASATTDVSFYHFSINDQLPAPSTDVTPIEVNGTMYIPYSVFDERISNIDIGVYSSLLRTGTAYTVTIYNADKLLTFNLLSNSTTDKTGQSVNILAIIRNNQVYVPARTICDYFNLTYLLYSTSYGNLLRITNGEEYLVGDKFLTSAANVMKTRYNDYLQTLTTTPTATATPTPTPTPTPVAVEDLNVVLAFSWETGQATEDILDTLDTLSTTAIFFFPADEILNQAQLIRRIVGSGHMVGISLTSETQEDATKELTQGLEYFRKVAQIAPHTILSQGYDWESALEDEGWVLWHTTLDGTPPEAELTAEGEIVEDIDDSKVDLSATALAYTIKALLNGATQQVNLLMDDSLTSAESLSQVMATLLSDEFQVLFPSEWNISQTEAVQ